MIMLESRGRLPTLLALIVLKEDLQLRRCSLSRQGVKIMKALGRLLVV